MCAMDPNQVVWRPTPDVIEASRLTRLLRKLQVPSLEALHKRSIEEPEWYWDAVVRDLGIRWTQPYTRVLDDSRGVAWPRWFDAGLLRIRRPGRRVAAARQRSQGPDHRGWVPPSRARREAQGDRRRGAGAMS